MGFTSVSAKALTLARNSSCAWVVLKYMPLPPYLVLHMLYKSNRFSDGSRRSGGVFGQQIPAEDQTVQGAGTKLPVQLLLELGQFTVDGAFPVGISPGAVIVRVHTGNDLKIFLHSLGIRS